VFARPATAEQAAAIAPQPFVSCRVRKDPGASAKPLCAIPRLRADFRGHALATLNVPFGYPARGTVNDRKWASIHSSPPWTDLDAPMIVENSFGAGR
jgi:hypothetical protein